MFARENKYSLRPILLFANTDVYLYLLYYRIRVGDGEATFG
jgi:hypothetical protein